MQLIGLTEASRDTYIRLIRRLILANYIEKQRLIAGESAYLLLGKRGADLLAMSRVKQLALNTLRHDMLVLDVYFDLLAKNPEYQIMSERELRIATGFKVGNKKKVPDLLINDKIAIEVELSEKSNARLIEIVGNYVRETKVDEVHYFVKSRALGHKLLELSGRHKKFKVFLLDAKSKDLVYSDMSNNVPNGKVVPTAPDSFNVMEYLQR